MVELLQTPNFWIGFGAGGVCIAVLFLVFVAILGAVDEAAVDTARDADADSELQREQLLVAEAQHLTQRHALRSDQVAGQRRWRDRALDTDGFAQRIPEVHS